jgi:hypothetical protein
VKPSITILFLLIFCNSYGQKWHLNRINESSKFKYEYWFQFENEDDTSSYIINNSKVNNISTIQVTDNKGNKVSFATITIKEVNNDSVFMMVTDVYGLGQISLKKGKYTILVSAVTFDTYKFDLSINENAFFGLNIKLGLGPELTVYQINSKTELTEADILTIIKCV